MSLAPFVLPTQKHPLRPVTVGTSVAVRVCRLLLVGTLMGVAGLAHCGTVDAVGITVEDADRAVAFYRDVLGFQVVTDREVAGEAYEHLLGVFAARVRFVRLRLGEEHVELIDYLAPPGRAIPADSRSNDRWFQHIAVIVSDMTRAYEHLRAHRVQHASPGPQRLPDWNPSAGGIEAFYFRDPDGNHLEILAFPPDKGHPKWHRGGDALFLGIDHTAIVVDDTDASLPFYRDVLGLRVVGESENFGSEQERLNSVFGARLKITTLRGRGGIGVEFLEYLAPGGGRPMPPDTRANDLWHWQIHVDTPRLDHLPERAHRSGGRQVSSQVVETADGALGFARAVMIRDRDGHASVLKTAGRRS